MANLPDLFDLTGRVAVVTGGSGLLGKEFCQTLVEAGGSVVIADIDSASAKNLAEILTQEGYRAIGLGVDVTKKESVQEMVESTLDSFGHIDILVNSAALDPKYDRDNLAEKGSLPSSFEDFPLEIWQEALDVNLTGIFLSCQCAVAPMLESGRGTIINIASIYGLVGPDQRIYQSVGKTPQFKPIYYSVTKAGLLGLTKYLATYYAGKSIRVNALTPGGVYNDHDESFVQAYSANTVIGRMANKNELNGALLFLASEASSYMTGSNLVVDGGWTAW